MTKLNDQTLAVLSALAIDLSDHDVPRVRIVEQLDRKLYLKVNEVLEAIGGKWDRREKAHLFDEDPTDLLELVLTTGEVTTLREMRKQDGWFPTPPPVADQLVAMLGPLRHSHGHPFEVYEPCAGEGALVCALLRADDDVRVTAYELDVKRATVMEDVVDKQFDRYTSANRCTIIQGDCFSFRRRYPIDCFDACVMNPPFGAAGQLPRHIAHVYDVLRQIKPGAPLVSVLPAGVTFRRDAAHVEFRKIISGLGGEITPLPDDAFKPSGTNVRTCVLYVRAFNRTPLLGEK